MVGKAVAGGGECRSPRTSPWGVGVGQSLPKTFVLNLLRGLPTIGRLWFGSRPATHAGSSPASRHPALGRGLLAASGAEL